MCACVSGLNRGAAHRCCSTVAAGSCCHTGSHTKLLGPTSFPLFPLLFRLLLSLRRLPFVLPSPRCQSALHAVTPSGLPHIHRHTNKHTSTCPGSPSTLPLLPHHQRQAASYATNFASAGCFQNKVGSKRQSSYLSMFLRSISVICPNKYMLFLFFYECPNQRLLYWHWWARFFYFEKIAVRILRISTYKSPLWQVILPYHCYYSNRLSSSSSSRSLEAGETSG